MRALSVRQPWAYAITGVVLRSGKAVVERDLGKRDENRDWLDSPGLVAQARSLVGHTLLLHASKGCTYAEFGDAVRCMVESGLVAYPGTSSRLPVMPDLPLLPRGVILARFRIAGLIETTAGGHRIPLGSDHLGSRVDCQLCGEMVTIGGVCPQADPWAVPGAVGLVLADVEPLPEPIPFKGSLGFFEVPDEVLRQHGAKGA